MRKIISYFAADVTPLNLWTDKLLSLAADKLAYKCLNLSPKLVNSLNFHPLHPPQLKSNQSKLGILVFNEAFLLQVANYHASVERPAVGTFSQTTGEKRISKMVKKSFSLAADRDM